MSILDKVREAIKTAVHAGKIIKGEEGVDSYHYYINEFDSEETAKAAFHRQKEIFLNLDAWTDLSDIENLRFSHFDADGNKVNRNGIEGDFLKIELPGPVPVYWVRAEHIHSFPYKVEVIVRPSYDPTERPVRKEVTAHFFDKVTLNKLTLERVGNRLIAETRTISAAVNNTGEEAGETSIINTTVALGGWA
ncbi:MAG: hypothetical protein M3512_16820, partial [Bacteroidota bacterium]|nr:hypothetical protein [Bacteroidota bacterium]